MLASGLRKIAIRLTHGHCRVEFEGPVRLGPGFTLNIPGSGILIVGSGVDFRRGFYCEISGSGRVSIGAGTTFTAEAMIQCTTAITIGAGVQVGQCALIVDGNHRFRDYNQPFLAQGYEHRPVTIGDGAVLLSKVTVFADVGERAVIGAHSLVNRDIPPWCLAVGTPAKVVDYFGPPERRPIGLEA